VAASVPRELLEGVTCGTDLAGFGMAYSLSDHWQRQLDCASIAIPDRCALKIS
jgi:hypothetical protein